MQEEMTRPWKSVAENQPVKLRRPKNAFLLFIGRERNKIRKELGDGVGAANNKIVQMEISRR